MDKKKILAEYNKKIKDYKKNNKSYFNKSKPLISDAKFDELKGSALAREDVKTITETLQEHVDSWNTASDEVKAATDVKALTTNLDQCRNALAQAKAVALSKQGPSGTTIATASAAGLIAIISICLLAALLQR